MKSAARINEIVSFGLLVGSVMAISAVLVWRRPDIYYPGEYLFDFGLNLSVADAILNGGLPYRDVATPYGPLPDYAYAGCCLIFGNKIATHIAYVFSVFVVQIALLYVVIRRHATLAVTWTTLIVSLPLIIPNAAVGIGHGIAYAPWERLVITLIMLVWRPPSQRGRKHSIAIGSLLGLWQFVKFGGAVFAGIGLATLDLMVLFATSGKREDYWHWLRSLAVIVATFAVFEAFMVAGAFAVLPYPIAIDFLWPIYAKQFYAEMLANERFFLWVNGKFFFTQQMNLLAGLAASVASIVVLLRSRGRPDLHSQDDAAVLLPFFFWVVAYPVYMGHMYHVYQHAWAFLLSWPYLQRRVPGVLKAAVLASLPSLLLFVDIAFVGKIPDRFVRFPLPNGETLYIDRPVAGCMQQMFQELDQLKKTSQDSKRTSVMFFPMGTGIHYLFGVPRFSRHTWKIRHYVRPYEMEELARRLPTAQAIVVTNNWHVPSRAPNYAWARPVYDEAFIDAVKKQVVRTVDICTEWRIYVLGDK